MPKTLEINAEHLIIGEGDGDAAFFRHLCQIRNIQGFQFDHADGNTDYRRTLEGIEGRTGFEKLRGILIVGDNDETPDHNFDEIRRQIGQAKLPQPDEPLHFVKRQNLQFAIAVLMVPFPRINHTSHGCLESMLLQSAEQHLAPQALCLNTYCGCVETAGWPLTSRDKMRLRCLISASYRDDPNSGIPQALLPQRNLIPLEHPYFNEIAGLLGHFGSWIASDYRSYEEWKRHNP